MTTCVLAVLAGLLAGCSGPAEPTGTDLTPRLRGGIFLEHDRPVALGKPPQAGDYPPEAPWTPLPIVRGKGWLRPTRGGWHPMAAEARLTYHAWDGESVGRDAELRLDLYRNPDVAGPSRLEVLLDGVTVGSAELEAGLRRYRFPVEASGVEMELALRFEPAPQRIRGESLPVTLTGFGVLSPSAVDATPSLGEAPPFDEEAGALRFASSGRLVATLPAPTSDPTVEIDWRCPGEGGRLLVSAIDRSGPTSAPIPLEACDDRWRRDAVSFDAADPVAALAIEVRPGGGSSVELRRATLRDTRVVRDPEESGSPPAPSRSQRPTHPDILLVVLDAARAKHFGFAGYARDTTPHLDDLATEALVFDKAYSECPSTSCSIPNLITGIPFLNVGTIFQGKKLPDEVSTLAEYLQPLGYRTVGFSANPNNSAARNTHQGFDRFRRLWGAHNQAELAREAILEQPADEPLYLQLHFLPPHQPYDPRPEFNRFVDPAYAGPVHPKISLRRYTEGFRTFGEEDLTQLVALYDGNLRMADYAVGQVLDAMREAGRAEEMLVVVTSDHGEAFGEHGDFQHNSTLFDEMLHVPLLVRLPRGERPDGVATSWPVALADVVPTILGYLGVIPRREVWGVDLLRVDAVTLEQRPLFHRTPHRKRPLYGIRWGGRKAMTAENVRWPLLMDLDADPGEFDDLGGARPELFTALALRLAEFIDASHLRQPGAGEDVELTPEEIERLRALGYVQ